MKIQCDELQRLNRLNGTAVGESGKTVTERHPDVTGSFSTIFNEQMTVMKGFEISCIGQEMLLKLTKIVRRHINDHLLRILINQYGQDRIGHLISESASRGEVPVVPKGCVTSKGTENRARSRDSIETIITDASQKYDVDADLIRAVIKTESDFKPTSISSKGAMGLMQLMPETAKDMGVENAFDPLDNIMGGTRYLKMLLNRYSGDVDLALSAYNWGMGNVERTPERMPEETKSYIVKVKKLFAGSLSQRQTA